MQRNQEMDGIIIPKEKLTIQAIDGLVDEFIMREGTDYGLHEQSFDDKKRQILKQLDKNHILILFDPETETTTLVRKENIKNSIQ